MSSYITLHVTVKFKQPQVTSPYTAYHKLPHTASVVMSPYTVSLVTFHHIQHHMSLYAASLVAVRSNASYSGSAATITYLLHLKKYLTIVTM